ncbi:MAG: hypothetical protein HY763_04295 [Planctomycetes bacterium]|nr:hypothetical protein [Planctomycetota bacterium]
MSPRSQVNPHTGYFPYPWTAPSITSKVDRRLQVHDADLDPAFNPGARYFIEGHYVHPDDSSAGNQDNSASYREVLVAEPEPFVYQVLIDDAWQTQRQQAAVRAWQDADPEVVETDLRVPGEGLFILAAKATLTNSGVWRYSYALQNLNSDRGARLFSVPLPAAAIVANIWFHDVDHHSGETYDLTDWPGGVAGNAVVWSTATYVNNPDANALRFDSIYSFGFDTNVEPEATSVTIGVFKPGFPMELSAPTIGPKLDIIDCNGNGVPDSCDLDCAAADCAPPCGGSVDCDANGMPDECQPDCNSNGIADPCDVLQCPPGDLSCADCNGNTRPDGCEPDCDLDGIPDVCDPPDDTDGDGITECYDRCPLTTPPGACACPAVGRCCWFDGLICWDDYPRDQCIRDLGVPDCIEAPCRLGCLVGDRDLDGDLDLGDIGSIQQCYSGPEGTPGYNPPSHECSINLDFDGDDDVDLLDWKAFHENCTGP